MGKNKSFKVVKVELPAYWASYLVNGDVTSVEDHEIDEIDVRLKDLKLDQAMCVDVSDESSFKRDLYTGLGTDMAEYTFHIHGQSEEVEADDDRDILRHVELAGTGYTLKLWATTRMDNRGQTIIGYEFKNPAGEVLFTGEDFAGSPMHADDSDDTLRSLLGFLTLRPGDTDREYFDSYTEAQMAYAESDAEYHSLWALEPEEGQDEMDFTDIDG